jgi:hypothetical protein
MIEIIVISLAAVLGFGIGLYITLKIGGII